MIQDTHEAAWRWQASACETLAAPFSAEVLRACMDVADARAALEPILAPYPSDTLASAIRDALPLRILGGLHFIALAARDDALASAYAALDATAMRSALPGAIRGQSELLAGFMTSAPQTNEVRRALCLVGGFLEVATRFGLPLRCLELGASAGLNSNWDRYAYDFGAGRMWGPGGAGLTLSGEWMGEPPPIGAQLSVAERRACDLSPIDVGDAMGALRLQAYIWPDQADRLERVRAATAIARAHPVTVETSDAAQWTQAVGAPRNGVATVVFHSVFLQYPPESVRAALIDAITRHGEAATAAAPFAWLRMEPKADAPIHMEVRLTTWPGGRDAQLADVHPHGSSVRWLG